MAKTAPKSMTAEEFLLWCLDQEDRYELVDGVPVRLEEAVRIDGETRMMAGASRIHDRIVTNIIATLHGQLRGSPCGVTTSDTAVRTRIRGLRRPDVAVTCDPPRADAFEAGEPRLVVEVLSPSSTGLDFERKLEEYRRREGLTYILLVETRKVAATLLVRQGDAWDSVDADDLAAILDMPDIGCRLTMTDVYEGLPVDAAGRIAAEP